MGKAQMPLSKRENKRYSGRIGACLLSENKSIKVNSTYSRKRLSKDSDSVVIAISPPT